MEQTFTVEQITPDFAIDVLSTKNKNNRGIKPASLKRLITAIDNDEWVVTNQGIVFDAILKFLREQKIDVFDLYLLHLLQCNQCLLFSMLLPLFILLLMF